MAEFVGGEPVSVGVNEPITFENKTDTAFDVSCGIVFRKSGLYRVSIVRRYISITVEPERQRGRWIEYIPEHGKCPFCGNQVDLLGGKANNFCGECGADMRQKEEGNV